MKKWRQRRRKRMDSIFGLREKTKKKNKNEEKMETKKEKEDG